jgi:DNA-directed RNA polymerase subunit K/omega
MDIIHMSDNENDIFDNESDEESVMDIETEVEEKPKFSKKITKVTIDDEEDDSDFDEDNEGVGDELELDDNDEDLVDDEENEDEFDDTKVASKTTANATSYVNDEDEFNNNNNEIYEDNESDEEPDETYLQKFDTRIRENFVDEFHPESYVHNYEEIAALTKVVRDKNNIIVDDLHRTIPILTKYEYARVIGQRAKQINDGARPYVSVPENLIEGYLIAQLELEQKKLPFIIRRPLPGKSGSEYWKVSDLEIVAM